MATTGKRSKKTVTKRGKKTAPANTAASRTTSRRPPQMRVIESGRGEQGIEPMAPEGVAPAGRSREAARKVAREEYRHGGIPIGSDPRE